ncbi:hypothetical protein C4556_01445 [Candidatus Parcubacteria bacterium]|nr:MAG: hypothetical protein C4556_01445 [Candidatus Parcubacteria bacterium]
MDPEEKELDAKMKERFAQLPKVVQDAITSADVEKRLRALADTHKLHLDQWETLENEVMLSLLGFSPVEELKENIRVEVGVPENTAEQLASDISKLVFEPVRQELERGLAHPEAKKEDVSNVEAARREVLEKAPIPNETAVPKPTEPIPVVGIPSSAVPPEKKAERGPASGAYIPGEPSSARKVVEDDPYREPPA